MKPGRNDPCLCGSSKKYKQCCLLQDKDGKATEPQASITQSLQAALAHYQAGRLQQAGDICRQVLETSPDHPDALHLSGLLARQEGKNDLAVELIGRAIKISPAALMYFNLGNAYRAQGKFDEAVASFRSALLLRPDYAQACNNLGLVLQLQGRLDDATACFLKAADIMPDCAEIYSNLGDVLQENGHLEAAEESLRHAIALKPGFASAHLNLGKALRRRGKLKEALSRYQQAFSLDPRHAGTCVALAYAYQDLGQFSLAREHIDRVLKLEPDNPEAWAVLPYLKKMTPEDKPWAEKALSLLEKRLEPREKMSLSYALGKYHDDTCQYEAAFAYYTRANQLKKRMTRGFDRYAFSSLVSSIISANDAEAMQKRHAGSSSSCRPLFIVGMPRSGTSLTEQILASHPQVFGAGELHFWDMKAAASPPHSPVWHDAALLAGVVGEYEAELEWHSTTALRVVDKMPDNFMNLGMIHAAFPDARILHMLRNPVDTCLSIYFQDFSEQHPYANDLEDLACYYREYQRLMDHWRKVLPPDIFIDVPYEALVEDQETWSRKLIEFTGLDWDETCLDFHRTERTVGTFSNWQVRQKIYKTSKERWRNYEKFVGPLLPLLELAE